jgi:hypothetical protein
MNNTIQWNLVWGRTSGQWGLKPPGHFSPQRRRNFVFEAGKRYTIEYSISECVGYQQNRVLYFHRKTTHQGKYYGLRPITAGPGLTPFKTKAKGQAPEPPSAPPFRPTPLRLVRPM